MTTRPLFVTQVYEASLAGEKGFAAFNAELEEACLMLADEDMAGRAWCKEHRYGGYTSYASLNDLPQRASVFGALKSKLDKRAAAFAADAPAAGRGRQRLQAFVQREVDRRMRPRLRPGAERVQRAVAPDAMFALEADQNLAVFAQSQPLGVARSLVGDRLALGRRQPPHPQIVQPRQLAVRIQFKPPAHQIAGIRHGDEAAVARQLEIGKAVQAGDGRRDQLHPARIAHALRQPCAAGPAQADLSRRPARGRPAVGRRLGRPGA